MVIKSGKASPLGATLRDGGINFCIFSPFADSVDLLIFKDEKDGNPHVINLNKDTNKTYYYWHVFIEGLQEGTIYAYRVNGQSTTRNKFDSSKVLLDPYGKAIVGNYNRDEAKKFGDDDVGNCLKNYVLAPSNFDWENIEPPKFSNSKNIIYELHPKGFTQDLDKPNAGSFSALAEQIPYLKELGVNTVELMPIFFFDEQDAPPGKSNYWGYSPISFFSLHKNYCFAENPDDAVNEFKNCIKEFHKNNIKVVLDVVYNHTAESNETGPTYSFKGISNTTYYYVSENGEYLDFTGCGNTLNTNHSVVRRMILDSLRYWKEEFHIDGFRFDLAGVLTRDEEGNHLEIPPVIWEIDSDPYLAKTMIIAEPWDLKGYNAKTFPGDKWSLWQDRFRDAMRKTLRGDEGMMNEFVECFTSSYNQDKSEHLYYKPQRNINFVTCHDGFTLNDLVSYDHKHNMANGEDNKDGSNNNLSCNYGAEGPTNNLEIEKVRYRQIKNFLLTLLFSHGTPMMSMGDEVRRTQFGNNNPYSLDIPENWFNWSLVEENENLFSFVKDIIRIRQDYKVFTYKDFFAKEPNTEKPYYLLHGTSLNQPDLTYYSHSVCIEYFSPKFNENILLIFNLYTDKLKFQLPKGKWDLLINTDFENEKSLENSIEINSRTIAILSSQKNKKPE